MENESKTDIFEMEDSKTSMLDTDRYESALRNSSDVSDMKQVDTIDDSQGGSKKYLYKSKSRKSRKTRKRR